MTASPPPIRGEVPPDYDGPICYRTRIESYAGLKKTPADFIKFEQRGVAHELASTDAGAAARRKAPQLFDQNSELLAKWKAPLKARLGSGAPKTWPEWGSGIFTVVSERVRDAIEDLDPGKHLFIAIDVTASDDRTIRLYALFKMRDNFEPLLALRANGIEFSLNGSGHALYRRPDWLDSDRFIFLNSSAIADADLASDLTVGNVFSSELMRKLGDVFPKGIVLVPCGLVNEPVGGGRP